MFPEMTLEQGITKGWTGGDVLLIAGATILLDRTIKKGSAKTGLSTINSFLDKTADSLAGIFPDAKTK